MSLRALVVLALLGILIWGSTYLAMRFAIESIPPLLMGGVRYISAGVLIFVALRLRGHVSPSLRQWRDTGIVGLCSCWAGMAWWGWPWSRESAQACLRSPWP